MNVKRSGKFTRLSLDFMENEKKRFLKNPRNHCRFQQIPMKNRMKKSTAPEKKKSKIFWIQSPTTSGIQRRSLTLPVAHNALCPALPASRHRPFKKPSKDKIPAFKGSKELLLMHSDAV